MAARSGHPSLASPRVQIARVGVVKGFFLSNTSRRQIRFLSIEHFWTAMQSPLRKMMHQAAQPCPTLEALPRETAYLFQKGNLLQPRTSFLCAALRLDHAGTKPGRLFTDLNSRDGRPLGTPQVTHGYSTDDTPSRERSSKIRMAVLNSNVAITRPAGGLVPVETVAGARGARCTRCQMVE